MLEGGKSPLTQLNNLFVALNVLTKPLIVTMKSLELFFFLIKFNVCGNGYEVERGRARLMFIGLFKKYRDPLALEIDV